MAATVHHCAVFQAERVRKGDSVKSQKPLDKNLPFYLGKKALDRNFFYFTSQYCTTWLPLPAKEVVSMA